MALFEYMTALLPRRLQPYAKAVWPLFATVVATLIAWADTGTFNDTEIRTAVGGLVLTLLAYGPPNNPAGVAPYEPEVEDRSTAAQGGV